MCADHDPGRVPVLSLFSVAPVLPVLVVLLVGVAAVGGFVLAQRQRDRIEATYQQVCRDHGLTPTDVPLGTSDAWLAQFELLPRGDRDHSAVWGLEGPVELQLGGAAVAATCVAFEWWWEDRHTSRSRRGGQRTTWRRRSVLVAMLRLPAPYVMPRVRVETEGVFARLGVGGRGDFQVESEEFNRRYDVRANDRHAAIRLFDPAFQSQLLGRFEATTFELAGDLALVAIPAPSSGLAMTNARRGGSGGWTQMFRRSGDRLRTDPAIVQALPGVRHRAVGRVQLGGRRRAAAAPARPGPHPRRDGSWLRRPRA